MINRRRYLAAVSATLTGTSVAFAATNTQTTLDVSPASDLQNGSFAEVSQLSGSFTVQRGHAQVVSGVELFKIELGSAEWSDETLINVFLMNGYDLGKVLGNPNAYIEVAVWYEVPDGSGSHTLSSGQDVKRDDHAIARMTAANGAVKLTPSVDDESTLYVLAQVTVPGGSPPGQQGNTELEFTTEVRRT